MAWAAGSLAAVRGRLAQAEQLTLEAARLDERRRGARARVETALVLASRELWVRGQPDRALARIEAAFRGDPLETLPVRDRPYSWLAALYADAGRPERARELQAELEVAMREDHEWLDDDPLSWIASSIALAEGRPREAIRILREAPPIGCAICRSIPLALAFEAAGEPDSAIAAYRHFVETPFLWRIWHDEQGLAYALERLAELHEEAGDLDGAARYATDLLDLWRDADPELRPRLDAAEAVLARAAAEASR